DTGGDGAKTTGPGSGDALEGRDDADDGAEQSDEGRRGADRREGRNALLQVVRRERGRTLNRAAHGVDDVVAVHGTAGVMLKLIFLQARQNDLGEVAVLVGLRLGHRECVLEPSLFEVFGDLRRV